MRVPSIGRVAVAASPNAVGGPRATLQLHQVTLGLRRTLGSRGEEALAHNGVRTVAVVRGGGRRRGDVGENTDAQPAPVRGKQQAAGWAFLYDLLYDLERKGTVVHATIDGDG